MPPKKSSKRKRGSNNDDEVVDINDENKTISKKTTKKSKARETSLSTDLINPSKEDVSVDNTDYPFGKVESPYIKIVSWNINGWNSVTKKGFKDYILKENPDIICLQETKIEKSKVPSDYLEGYKCFFNECTSSKGHHGTGVFIRVDHLNITKGLGKDDPDDEGRVITIEMDDFYLINTYVPNSGRGLVNLTKRLKWNQKFNDYVNELTKKKPIIWCGDLNVSHKEIDLKNPKTNTKTAGFTKEERDDFTKFLNQGFIDTYRHFFPNETDCYTFWSTMRNSREKNVGWRLDYFVVSESFMENISKSYIRKHVLGSDHCPIVLHVKLNK